MKYNINDNCIACGNCMVVCPHNAIETGYSKPKSNSTSYGDPFLINDNCLGCGECEPVCGFDAISKVQRE